MLGRSRTRYEVFWLRKDKKVELIKPKVEVNTSIILLPQLTKQQLKDVQGLLGKATVAYMRLRYGSPETYVLLAYVGRDLAYAHWIVPWYKVQPRYGFVTDNTYALMTGETALKYRRMKIYTAQLQEVANSDIPTDIFWGWVASNNIPSLKGIRRAGAERVGWCIQNKWCYGVFSRVKYLPE